MSLKHTKSPSGKTHRLTHTSGHQPPVITSVTLRYRERPQFDDQVQGDLLRKMQAEHNLAWGVGRLSTHIDPDLLDRGQKPHSLDYLRGYLAGLTEDPVTRSLSVKIKRVREQIAALEAQQNGVTVHGLGREQQRIRDIGGPVSAVWNGGPPPASAQNGRTVPEERPQTPRDRHRTQGYSTVAWDPEEARAAASREIEYGPDVHEEEH